MNIKLICDSRERQSTLPLFPKESYIEERTLTTGDYAIISCSDVNKETIYYIFERKTWADLASSIKDGRIEKQIRNMRDVNCMRYIILEGKFSYKPMTDVCGIPFYKLDAMRRKIMMYGFYFIQTKSPQHTVDFLTDFTKQFAKNIESDNSIRQLYGLKSIVGGKETEAINNEAINNKTIFNETAISTDNMVKLTTAHEYTDSERVTMIWSAFPKIGLVSLPSFQKYSLIDITNLSHQEISDIPVGNKRFGNAAASVIIKLLDEKNSRAAVNIMAEFPGISKKSANYINRTITLRQFFTEDMSMVVKSELGSKIGSAAATITRLVSL